MYELSLSIWVDGRGFDAIDLLICRFADWLGGSYWVSMDSDGRHSGRYTTKVLCFVELFYFERREGSAFDGMGWDGMGMDGDGDSGWILRVRRCTYVNKRAMRGIYLLLFFCINARYLRL